MMISGGLLVVIALISWDDPIREASLPALVSRDVDFEQDIRPILAKSCLGCHGSKKRKGGLSLHLKSTAFAGGDEGPVIVAGKPTESRMFRYVSGLDDDHPMPPPGVGEPLSEAQVEVIRSWIEQGARWPDDTGAARLETSDHWSFRKPVRPDLPEVEPSSWPRNPIDHFVLARLDREGLEPSPEADRTTLIRRLSLDLIGLPPTIAEVDAFVEDQSPDAYDRLVDRLLASPHYGERWARRWLDGARYADTNGYEKDRDRSIWPYRDWVIRALNDDMPFDRFTIEQIAGDLLPDASTSQKVATGFHRNTMINEEGGIDVEEFRFASLVDRVATTGAVWLGLTIQCAQCHTHKFDPITQREYYQFLSFLNNADEPDLELPEPSIAARRSEIERKIRELEAGLADRFPDFDPSPSWEILTPRKATSTAGSSLEIRPDGSIMASGEAPPTDIYEVESEAELGGVTSIRLEALTDSSLPSKGPGRAPNGNFVLVSLTATGPADQPISLTSASADVSQQGFEVAGAIDRDDATGWAVDAGAGRLNLDHWATFRVAGGPLPPGRSLLKFRLDQNYGGSHNLGRFRLSVGRDTRTNEGDPEARRRARLEARRNQWESGLRLAKWSPVTPSSMKSAKHATMSVLEDRSVLVTGDKPNNDTYEVSLPVEQAGITALRVEVLPHESLPEGGPGRAPLFSVGNFFLSEVEATLQSPDGSKSHKLAIRDASADFEEKGKSAANTLDGKTDTGWSIGGAVGKAHAIVFRFEKPLDAPLGSRLLINLHQTYIHQTTIGRFRISTTDDPEPPIASGLPAEIEAIAIVPPADRTPDQSKALEHYFLTISPEMAEANAEIAALRKSMPNFATSMVFQERSPSEHRTTHIHRRGEFLQTAEPVEPGVPAVLHPLPESSRRDRLALARWLVSGENPLVGRVITNRAWQAFFGRGLVATLDDFGTRGERPTHPELLDWLATEFPRMGWSQKALHRLIVTSATYRQSSRSSGELLERDPRNELLARGPRFRVDAEMVRDIALSAAGLLDSKLGGPSVYPPQPDGVTSLAYGQTAWPTSEGSERYRRGLYTFAKRTAPFAAFATFDAPTSDVACVRRERSNTPLQALTLLNDPAFVEASRALGRRVVAEGEANSKNRARLAFRLCVGRNPTDSEVASILDFRAGLVDRLRAGELDGPKIIGPVANGDPVELASWSMVARALLNLDETITKE
ncbi:PSD1 and planctomycete cytochrome C domain-containing protein [Tundrisphaera lichenicola]|uniref:PSD1 and planctomycete cytochrome C domain-containing protein n=1 Tax=Tundrisphaera lichenicola TaxID=2029860 RepID=UPI003EB9D266